MLPLIIIFSIRDVKLWNTGKNVNKKEGEFELASSLFIEGTTIVDCGFEQDILILIHQGSNGLFEFSLVKVSSELVQLK